jgi:hypothetical protein
MIQKLKIWERNNRCSKSINWTHPRAATLVGSMNITLGSVCGFKGEPCTIRRQRRGIEVSCEVWSRSSTGGVTWAVNWEKSIFKII